MAAQAASAEVVEVIHRRMQNGADLVARSLSATRLKDVAGTAGFAQMLIEILRNTPAIDPDELRTAERLARTAEFKHDLVERAGGALTAGQVQKLLGYRSVQAVHKAVASRPAARSRRQRPQSLSRLSVQWRGDRTRHRNGPRRYADYRSVGAAAVHGRGRRGPRQ